MITKSQIDQKVFENLSCIILIKTKVIRKFVVKYFSPRQSFNVRNANLLHDTQLTRLRILNRLRKIDGRPLHLCKRNRKDRSQKQKTTRRRWRRCYHVFFLLFFSKFSEFRPDQQAVFDWLLCWGRSWLIFERNVAAVVVVAVAVVVVVNASLSRDVQCFCCAVKQKKIVEQKLRSVW